MKSQTPSALSYITTCKGRLSHLKQSLPRIADQPHIECIVVDYGCPERSGDWVAENFPHVKVIRAGATESFNASHARNLGARAASSDWLGFFDADILLDKEFGVRVIPQLQSGMFYRPIAVTAQTWGSIICRRGDFEAIGGYDEAYIGWGGEDDDLVAMLGIRGVHPAGFPSELLGEVTHSEQERTRFFQIKDRWIQSYINQLYLAAKLDMLHFLRRQPSPEEARIIFSEIEKTLSQARAAQYLNDIVINLTLPDVNVFTCPFEGKMGVATLNRRITYTLNWVGEGPVQNSR